MPKRYHIIVYVPISHAEILRECLAKNGVGKLGAYDSCSFSCRGIGRFRPMKGSHPAIGQEGKLEEVAEERIEAIVETASEDALRVLIQKIREVHPYEEPAISVLQLTNI